jgi:hypothetical protein
MYGLHIFRLLPIRHNRQRTNRRPSWEYSPNKVRAPKKCTQLSNHTKKTHFISTRRQGTHPTLSKTSSNCLTCWRPLNGIPHNLILRQHLISKSLNNFMNVLISKRVSKMNTPQNAAFIADNRSDVFSFLQRMKLHFHRRWYHWQ